MLLLGLRSFATQSEVLLTKHLLLKDPLIQFLAVLATLFVVWFLGYRFLIEPQGDLDLWLIDKIKAQSEWLLESTGYELLPESSNAEGDRYIGVQGGHYLWIGNPCNGLSIFVVFSIFIIAFQGPFKHKIWFIPLGIFLIHYTNVLRVAALCAIVKFNPDLLNLNHDAIFYVVVYGLVIFLWYIWVTRFAGKSVRPA